MNPPKSRPKQNISLNYWHLLGRWWRKTYWESRKGSSCLPRTKKKKKKKNHLKTKQHQTSLNWLTDEPLKITHREISVLLNILSQRLANYDQWAISGLPSVFCKCGFIGTKPHPFLYVLSRAVLVLTAELSSWDKDHMAAKPKIFTTWPFPEKVYRPRF